MLECALKNVIVGDSAGAVRIHLQAGHRVEQGARGARRRERLDDVWFMTSSRFALWTSTTGVSPVTVIVSASAADLQIGVDRRDEGARELDALALDGAEAREREVTSYVPGRRSMMGYCRAVGDGRLVFSMSAGLEASTVTPGSTAPDASDGSRQRRLREHRGREQQEDE